MNRESFLRIMEDTEAIQNASTSEIEELVESFPYCQTSRILLTRKLRLEEHHNYDTVLNTTAVFAGDRSMLRYHVEMQNTVDETPLTIQEEEEKITEQEEALADNSAQEQMTDIAAEEEITPEEADDIQEEESIEEPSEESPEVREVLTETVTEESEKRDEDTDDRFLKVKEIIEARLRKIDEEQRTDSPSTKKKTIKKEKAKEKKIDKQAELIDEFIRKQPAMPRPQAQFFNPEDAAKESVVDEENIVSETLARIYYDQKHYEKAINIYRKLSLIYPEKSTYFAAQIEKAVEELKK